MVVMNFVVVDGSGFAVALMTVFSCEHVSHHLGDPLMVMLHRSKQQLRCACHNLGELCSAEAYWIQLMSKQLESIHNELVQTSEQKR